MARLTAEARKVLTLARLQAAVARWPHLAVINNGSQGGAHLVIVVQAHSTDSAYDAIRAECSQEGGRCALVDADLAAVVEAATANRIRQGGPRVPFIPEYMLEDPGEEARDG